MRLLWSTCLTLFWVMLLCVLIVKPSKNFKIELYKGAQENSITQIYCEPLDSYVHLNRFPCDTLIMYPIKLLPKFDVSFVQEAEPNLNRPNVKDNIVIDSNSLGYCYLLSITAQGRTLPCVDVNSKENQYDVSYYSSEPSFNLTNISLAAMSKESISTLLLNMGSRALANTQEVHIPSTDTIAEISLGDVTRYVYIYNDKGSVYDPEHPTNTKLQISNNLYKVMSEEWAVTRYVKVVKGE